MNNRNRITAIVFFLSLFFLSFSNDVFSQTEKDKMEYKDAWREVDSLIGKGLPGTALKKVQWICEQTGMSHNVPQHIKSLLYTIRLSSDYQEDFLIDNIYLLEQEAADAEPPEKQIIYSILADLRWQYYQQNRHLILNRTPLAGERPEDFSTWDLKTYIEAVSGDYIRSIQNADALDIPIGDYAAITDGGKDNIALRPTLFDFLAHRALDFFMNSEAFVSEPENAFRLDDAAYFHTVPDFIGMDFGGGSVYSLKKQALDIFRELFDFHLNDQHADALIDADLKRLEFVHNHSVLPLKDSLYRDALHYLAGIYSDHEASAQINYKLAESYYKSGQHYEPLKNTAAQWDVKQAVELCQNSIESFPSSYGARLCKNLLQMMLKPGLEITIPKILEVQKKQAGLASFRNINSLFFRIIKITPEQEKEMMKIKEQSELMRAYLDLPIIREWSYDLPDKGDYQTHSAEFMIPELEAGLYILLASPSAEFLLENTPMAHARFWASDIAFINREDEEGNNHFYVMSRSSGKALNKMEVKARTRDYDYRKRQYVVSDWESFETDKEGHFQIPANLSKSTKAFVLDFHNKDDRYISDNYFYHYQKRDIERKLRPKTFFFTDRSIYKPGQEVFFKGLTIETDGIDNSIKADYKTKVSFYDANGRLISDKEFISNEYGSFQASFIIPTGLLNGRMSLRNESGSVSFNVEEYKRPGFEVIVDELKDNYKIDETINVNGRVKAFAGNMLPGVSIEYTIKRRTHFPFRYSYDYYIPYLPIKEVIITNDTLITDNDGEFLLSFTAKSDPSVSKNYEPVFDFIIEMKATNINGETHEKKSLVSVGYKALFLNTSLPDVVDRQSGYELSLKALNLNGIPQKTEPVVEIYRLDEPGKIYRKKQWEQADTYLYSAKEYEQLFPEDVYKNEDDPANWAEEKLVYHKELNLPQDSVFSIPDLAEWEPGYYAFKAEAMDSFGEKVSLKKYFVVFSNDLHRPPVKQPSWFYLEKSSAEPGDFVSFSIGSAYDDVNVLFELIKDKKSLYKEWLKLNSSQKTIEIPVIEEYRGNISLCLVFFKDNREYTYSKLIEVPIEDKSLSFEIENFRDKVEPSEKQEWRIKISDKQGKSMQSEILASMYDASLDAFLPHKWNFSINEAVSRLDSWKASYSFGSKQARKYVFKPERILSPLPREYPTLNWFGYNSYRGYYGMREVSQGMRTKAMAAPGAEGEAFLMVDEEEALTADKNSKPDTGDEINGGGVWDTPKTERNPFTIRRDFRETAFFRPQLLTDREGSFVLSFQMPESLTKWKFMGMAHDKDLKYGFISKELNTIKDFMISPNLPRYFRQGDTIKIRASLTNLSKSDLSATAVIKFFDAETNEQLFLLTRDDRGKSIRIDAGATSLVEWEIALPYINYAGLICRIEAKAGNYTDAEENLLPVLSNRSLVTESFPLFVNPEESRSFTFKKLKEQSQSKSLKNYRLTLEMTSNPAWYAVQALPYLSETPYESAEAVFSRFYANSLASFIANSSPQIRQLFEMWRTSSPESLLSPLQKNEELKSLALEATPWFLQAKTETEQKMQIAKLFNTERLEIMHRAELKKLKDLQLPNGAWPWFNGMRANPFITRYIVSGFGHMNQLGVFDMVENNEIWQMLRNAVSYLDKLMVEEYIDLKEKDGRAVSRNQIHYLYARSFFIGFNRSIKMDAQTQEAYDYFLKEAGKSWTGQSPYMQAMMALSFYRNDYDALAQDIIKSLKDRALHSEEMGIYWRQQNGFYWYQAPVGNQALMIEAFDEIADDKPYVEGLKKYLLKLKQTTNWGNSKSTADAVYALLLKGSDLLSDNETVKVKLGETLIDPDSDRDIATLPGTAYYKTVFAGEEIKPEMGDVEVIKEGEGISWGGLYWQYFEDLDKITTHGGPLSIDKKVYKLEKANDGERLVEIDDRYNVSVGDKLKVRIILSVDRPMEFVHMKDMRASGLEPVNAVSSYKYQGGLGYYESPGDAAVNFFFSYLPKGKWVFEYPLLANQSGSFSNGITSVECMYAPEFGSHSEGIRIHIRP